MIRLGLRLTLRGGREAFTRLAITVAAVGVGVTLLLVALAGMNAIGTQNTRGAWLATGYAPGPATADPHLSPIYWQLVIDHFEGRMILRVDLAATGSDSPVPPGIPKLPGPGQYYASPALARLIASTPPDQLADRFPGKLMGRIGPAALPAPDSYIIVIGHTAAELSAAGALPRVTAINTDASAGGPATLNHNRLQVILAVGALALFFPIVMFIGASTRLAAARREQRFAAMRLIGATPRQVSVVSGVEGGVAAAGGVVVGLLVFIVSRPLILHADITGQRFASGDLSLSTTDILVTVIGVPIAATIAALLSLRRLQISPLGVSRRVTPVPPGPARLIPLVAGIVELYYFVRVGRPRTTGGQIEAYFTGCLLILIGLITAGPWLTMVGSRVMARYARRPSVLLAARRLGDNPRAAFRAVSGLIIALFATSVSVGIIGTIFHYDGSTIDSSAKATVAIALNEVGPPDLGRPLVALPAGLIGQLQSVPGVLGVSVVYTQPSSDPRLAPPSYVLCDQLAHTPAIGHCRPGATVASLPDVYDLQGYGNPADSRKLSARMWAAGTLSGDQVVRLPVRAVVAQTNGSGPAIERVRTLMSVALPDAGTPATLGEVDALSLRNVYELRQMTNVVMLVSLVVAGCSLAVSVTGGVNDRKRPFSLLRLSGVPLAVLRRVVGLEAALPLLVVSAVSAGMGFLAAALFLRSQLGESLQSPGAGFYVLIAAGLAGSLAVIASTLPIIDRITGPEVARND